MEYLYHLQCGLNLCTTRVNFYLWRCCPFTAKTRFDPRTVYARYLVENFALRQVSLRVFRSSPVSSTPTMLLHTHLRYQKDKLTTNRNLPKSNALTKTGEHRRWKPHPLSLSLNVKPHSKFLVWCIDQNEFLHSTNSTGSNSSLRIIVYCLLTGREVNHLS